MFIPSLTVDDMAAMRGDEPWMMTAQLPTGASFLSVNATPSLIDLMGFSGGGGPPAFSYIVDPSVTTTYEALLFLHYPGTPIVTDTPGLHIRFCGVVQVRGMLLSSVEVTGPALDELKTVSVRDGFKLVAAVQYKVPDIAKDLTKRILDRSAWSKP